MEWSKKEIRKYYSTVLRYYLGNIVIVCMPLLFLPAAIWVGIEFGGVLWLGFGILAFTEVVLGMDLGLPALIAITDIKYRNLMRIDINIEGAVRDYTNTTNRKHLLTLYPFPDIKYVLFAENGDKFLIKKKFGRKYSLKQFEYPINARIVYCRESKIVVSMIVDDKEFA